MIINNYEDYIKRFSVSRETTEKFYSYVKLLQEWNQKTNLVGKSTISDIWMRHIVDSAQLCSYIDDNEVVCDVGSGAGLPGLIISYMGIKEVHLVESDGKKVSFLQSAAKISEQKIFIHKSRIENLQVSKVDCVVSRALAPLWKLLNLLKKIPSNRMILHKGKNLEIELAEAQRFFSFAYNVYPSIVKEDSYLLQITNLSAR
jgi:16S rRNA (guanine527-N7)-methyltransferase